MTYPYIEKHRVWGNEFEFLIENFQAEDWYGVLGYQKRFNANEATARAYWDSWNPSLRSLLKIGDIVIDCGAHHGHIAIACAKFVGDAGRVIALEASNYNVEILRRNVLLNELSNIEIMHRAVAEVSGKFLSIKHEQVFPGGEFVETIALDDLDIKPDVIKIDVEGYELPVLLGASNILQFAKPRFEVEVHLDVQGVDMRARGFHPSQIIELFTNNGYKIKSADSSLITSLHSSCQIYCHAN